MPPDDASNLNWLAITESAAAPTWDTVLKDGDVIEVLPRSGRMKAPMPKSCATSGERSHKNLECHPCPDAEGDHENSHRLLAIGHLHEAEEESLEWPALRAMIRQARRRYQNHNAAPDWEALSREIARIAPKRRGRVTEFVEEYAI